MKVQVSPMQSIEPHRILAYVCSGGVVITAYDFESGRPGSNHEWGLIYYEARSLHRAYPSLHLSGVVH